MLTEVTKDIWVDPKKVEMVIVEKGANHEGHNHEPFVILGFQGGGGRTLPPEIKVEDVIATLNGVRVETPPVFNSYIQNDHRDSRLYLYLFLVVLLCFIGGALIF